ncbi:MAG: shikimate kinase [Bifidobacteriaceae bacterium]|jgi:shikimate kinase|nr:shikimate kinase [Bifidobacteriaceae bacterium]
MSALVLIGPPGSGKTTTGRELAGLLRLPFLDTDHMVEAQSGRTISDIFVREGEDAFRALERTAVAEAMNQAAREGVVVALGGGAPMDQSVAAAISHSTVVFLDVSAVLAARRIGLNASRPLLAESPRKVWRELMARRRPVYETLADIIIPVDGFGPTELARRIASALAKMDGTEKDLADKERTP